MNSLFRIVFWNVNRKDLDDLVCALASTENADIVVLSECTVPSQRTLESLHSKVSEGFHIPPSNSEDRFHCFSRRPLLDASEVHKGFRTSVRKLNLGSKHLLLGLVHGVDIRNYDSETRQSVAQDLATELRFVKAEHHAEHLILLGDFNMNPHDRAMNLAMGLNAMMTRECVAAGYRTFLGKQYELYYNPMWSLLGDNTEGPAGTVYDTSNQGLYGWNMLDQVIISHSCVGLFGGIQILTQAGETSLVDARGRPDANRASDHLPIVITLRGERRD